MKLVPCVCCSIYKPAFCIKDHKTHKNLSIKWSSLRRGKKVLPMEERLCQNNFPLLPHCQPLMSVHEPFLQK